MTDPTLTPPAVDMTSASAELAETARLIEADPGSLGPRLGQAVAYLLTMASKTADQIRALDGTYPPFTAAALAMARAWRGDPAMVPAQVGTPPFPAGTRYQWVFRHPWGCPYAVLEGQPSMSAYSAWLDVYDHDVQAIGAAQRAGRFVERVPHDRYRAEVEPQMRADWVCPHGGRCHD